MIPETISKAARRVAPGTVACQMRAVGFRPAPLTGSCSSASFLNRKGFAEFRRVVSRLRELCPTGKPVVIRTAWLPPTTLGECIRRPSRFVIRLNNRLDEQGAIETVLHEWGHACAGNVLHSTHGSEDNKIATLVYEEMICESVGDAGQELLEQAGMILAELRKVAVKKDDTLEAHKV